MIVKETFSDYDMNQITIIYLFIKITIFLILDL